jgi:hypothetical protein
MTMRNTSATTKKQAEALAHIHSILPVPSICVVDSQRPRNGRGSESSACLRRPTARQRLLPPSRRQQGIPHHGKHKGKHPRVHAHLFQLTLRLQMSSLTFGSAGEAAVTRQPKRASATTTKTSSTPHHTPRTATKQHDKLHRMTAKLLWYVSRRLVRAQQRILTWSCRFARFAFTARVRPPASGMSHLPPTHTTHFHALQT